MKLSLITATVGRYESMMHKLQSLERQNASTGSFEWVVCGSPGDRTIEMLRESFASFPIRLIESREQSVGARRNLASNAARGDILLLSDDDCIHAPDCVTSHIEAQATPCVAIGAIRFREGRRSRLWQPRRVGFWNVNGANTSFPRDAFQKVGGFDLAIRGYGGEDVLLGYSLSKAGLPIVSLAQAVVDHLGPDAMASGSLDKARSAGGNAFRISSRYPELAFRLGVHPALLFLKQAFLNGLVARLVHDARYRYELAYLEGALAARKEEGDDDAPAN
jgi:GT2 family glycosyltransferase